MKTKYVIAKIIVFIVFIFLCNYIFEERCMQNGRYFYEYEFYDLTWPFIAVFFIYIFSLFINNKIVKKVCILFECVLVIYNVAYLLHVWRLSNGCR